MKRSALCLFILVLVATGCAGQEEDAATATAVPGPALLMFYTDN